jgi:hypothetical protein
VTADRFDGYVYWEDEPGKRRKVKSICSACQRISNRDYRLPLLIDKPPIVSPTGIVHSDGEYGITDCGRDATGPEWWWRS